MFTPSIGFTVSSEGISKKPCRLKISRIFFISGLLNMDLNTAYS